ncbi:hypothetical protein [Streptomyces sp. FH025]|uniref:hypothetical protein n=1 Tax=Streptomyces sp. FH025 TaxID=2815937 RepID=UPI001A9FD078|nr:hypothetical protein [Streptomyces sp. FH025]MBO1416416.1 hypothetical protein [Streptomyces sp. FH025]
MSTSKRILVLALAVAAALGGTATVFVMRSGTTELTPAQTAQARRLTLALAGVLPRSEDAQFDLDLATRTEQLIAGCMPARGFQYVPKNPRSLVDTETSTDFSSLEYAQKHGFGIAAWPAFLPSHENDSYTASLSEEAATRYDQALSSCSDDSREEAGREFGVDKGNSDYNKIDKKVTSSARYQAAGLEWMACAKNRGYDYPSRLDLIRQLRGEYQKIMNELHGRNSDGKPYVNGEIQARAEADSKYQEFRQKEVSAAVATFPCSQTLDRVYREVFIEEAGYSTP